MISPEDYDALLAAKHAAAPLWPPVVTLGEEIFEVHYHHRGDGRLQSFALVDSSGVAIFSCSLDDEAKPLELTREAILNLIAHHYFDAFQQGMADRLAALYLQVRLEEAKDNYESWSWRERAGILEDRLRYGVTPEQVDSILGKPAGYTLSIEAVSYDLRLSELVNYRAAITTALLLRRSAGNA